MADALLCAKCQTNPRFGSLQRCKACLKTDAEAERIARERLLPPRSAARPNRQQATASRAVGRKPVATAPTAPASKALTVVARPSLSPVVPSIVAKPVRELGRPFTPPEWQTMITQTLQRWRRAGTLVQNNMAEESLAAKTIRENVVTGRVTYSSTPLLTLRPQSNAAASLLHWALVRVGVHFDVVDEHGDISDSRTLCKFCDTKVKRQPCTESQSRSCRNRR